VLDEVAPKQIFLKVFVALPQVSNTPDQAAHQLFNADL
jgi:hypothetical protein